MPSTRATAGRGRPPPRGAPPPPAGGAACGGPLSGGWAAPLPRGARPPARPGGSRPSRPGGKGKAGATAWWGGGVEGDWHQTEFGEGGVRLLEDVGAEATGGLDAGAARLTAWLDGARVAARFPSPLAKSRRPSR